MGSKHRKAMEPTFTQARDTRKGVYKYYHVDDSHTIAVPGGRCYKCSSITDSFCDKCNAWACGKHLSKANELDLCENCRDE